MQAAALESLARLESECKQCLVARVSLRNGDSKIRIRPASPSTNFATVQIVVTPLTPLLQEKYFYTIKFPWPPSTTQGEVRFENGQPYSYIELHVLFSFSPILHPTTRFVREQLSPLVFYPDCAHPKRHSISLRHALTEWTMEYPSDQDPDQFGYKLVDEWSKLRSACDSLFQQFLKDCFRVVEDFVFDRRKAASKVEKIVDEIIRAQEFKSGSPEAIACPFKGCWAGRLIEMLFAELKEDSSFSLLLVINSLT